MQEEHAKAEAAEREAERRVERDFMHAETVPLMHRLTELKQEISALREELSSSGAAVDDKPALREKRGGPL
jgi:hypothetical protein